MKRWAVFLVLFALLPCLAGQGRGHGGGVGRGQGRGASAPPAGGKHAGGERTTAPSGHTATARGHQPNVADQLARHPGLSSRLEKLLPAGTNLPEASSGFKNLGQFVAAAHVSRNLNIPFDQLKTQVAEKGSLGKAIRALKPDMSPEAAKAEAKSAEQQAKEDIERAKAEGKALKPHPTES